MAQASKADDQTSEAFPVPESLRSDTPISVPDIPNLKNKLKTMPVSALHVDPGLLRGRI